MFKAIFSTFANCFKIPELKSRILFTALVLAVCRLVALIPLPGLDGATLAQFFEQNASKTGGLLGMYSLFTGGALERCALGSLGIMPYISATIIIQLLSAVVPQLSKMIREEGGRTKIIQYGRYLTVLLCLGQGFFMALSWENPEKVFGAGFPGNLVLMENLWGYRIQTVLFLTTGTLLLMWLGEQITDRGIGNGVSLVITIGILSRLPMAATATWMKFFPPRGVQSSWNFFHAIALILLLLAVVAAVIAVTQAQRKIPVQYAQRAVGRKVYAGGTSFMPLRVNYAGVMPIIFAQAILMFPEKIFYSLAGLTREGSPALSKLCEGIYVQLQHGTFTYLTLEGLMILFFSYFWVATQFNEIQIADDLKKYGGYIPGVRPGQHTSDFLHRAMSRITLAGAIFLAIIAVLPTLLFRWVDVPFEIGQFFGGTSLLITVGVLLDTMRQMESHLLMRHYDGFLKKGRIRGRF
ncbi:MAG TPA: preprotein translocase subunit SecY [Verrucomicrobiota bacterium]|nr:preprotein translocase subunit SecY [Verrucomicrobiota bacterium]HNU50270.1 preprotein translocase subunit SecY [Verrucomicrobiota bacterium]